MSDDAPLPSFVVGDGELLQFELRADGSRVSLHKLGREHFVVTWGGKRRSFPTYAAALESFRTFCRKDAP